MTEYAAVGRVSSQKPHGRRTSAPAARWRDGHAYRIWGAKK